MVERGEDKPKKTDEDLVRDKLWGNLYGADDEEDLFSEMAPLVIEIFNRTKMFYKLENKATDLAIKHAEEGDIGMAGIAAQVSSFFHKARTLHANMLRELGADPTDEEYRSVEKIKKSFQDIKDTPSLKGFKDDDGENDDFNPYFSDYYPEIFN